jgi:quercetin dioxygenase-like cupin family protein
VVGDDEPRSGLTLVPPGGGRRVVRMNGEDTVLVVGEAETRGAYAARLNAAPPGFTAVPLHVHRDADEAFLVLDGELTVQAGRTVNAPAGAFVLIARGQVHAIANVGTVPVRWLTLISPAASAGWVEAEHDLLVGSTGAPDPARFEEIHHRFGLEILGPSTW